MINYIFAFLRLQNQAKFVIMKYTHVIIGDIIKKMVAEKGLTSSAFAKLIGKQRQNMESTVFSKASIDTDLLKRISEVLDYDFFEYYRPIDEEKDNCNKKNYNDGDKEEIKATLTIELKKETKEQVLKLVFGENNFENLK